MDWQNLYLNDTRFGHISARTDANVKILGSNFALQARDYSPVRDPESLSYLDLRPVSAT